MPFIREALAKPLWGVCKREVRIQKTGVRIIVHVARERVPILNTEFWLLNTALAEPTKEVLQAPQGTLILLVLSARHNSDSCILTPDFSLANTPEGFCKSLTHFGKANRRRTGVRRLFQSEIPP
jgi:hypothetical protein